MNSRERVLTTLRHEEPDRVPFDLGSFKYAGIHREAYKNLLRYLGMDNYISNHTGEYEFHDVLSGAAEMDQEVLQKLGVDVRGAIPNSSSDWELDINHSNNYKFFTDEFGITWFKPEGGYYYDQRPGESQPLSGNITLKDIEEFDWPEPRDPERLKGLEDKLSQLRNEGYATVMRSVSGGAFQTSFRMRGYEQFYKDLAGHPELAYKLMEKLADFKIEFWDMLLDKVGYLIDIIVEPDDLGAQDRTLISKSMYRELVKPHHKRLFSFIKYKSPNIFTMLHSDGNISGLIPDLIEAGVDVLTPVQVGAKGMNARTLKQKYGDAISFWGAGVNTQTVLPNGTPKEVKEEVGNRIETFAPGGGFVFAAIHNIQADVPPENIVAMWEAYKDNAEY